MKREQGDEEKYAIGILWAKTKPTMKPIGKNFSGTKKEGEISAPLSGWNMKEEILRKIMISYAELERLKKPENQQDMAQLYRLNEITEMVFGKDRNLRIQKRRQKMDP